jgi:hypothetical protein
MKAHKSKREKGLEEVWELMPSHLQVSAFSIFFSVNALPIHRVTL